METVGRHAMVLDTWLRERMTLEDTFLDAYIEHRDWAKLHPDEAQAMLAALDEGAVANTCASRKARATCAT